MHSYLASVRCLLLWGLVLLLPACIDSYSPDILTAPRNYLVVDGFINSQGVSTIKLSRTFAIAAKPQLTPEVRATVYIEEEAGSRYLLREGVGGAYSSDALILNPSRPNRLHLTTTGGQEYASDYVPVKTTPPIDELEWRAEDTQLGIYVSAHDETKATRYYRWEYEETWEILPVYRPIVEYVDGEIRNLAVPYPTICWGNVISTAVQLHKTTALSQDVVADYRIRVLPTNSDHLNTRYSILVKQFALTKEEYGYWELLRKNTENIGTLFDPQPVQLTGNVHCLSDANELALGFVGAHSLVEQRIFITRAELPDTWNVLNGYEDCVPPDSVFIDRPIPHPPVDHILQSAFASKRYLPITPIGGSAGQIHGYTAKSRDCIDCRTRGADVRPSFW